MKTWCPLHSIERDQSLAEAGREVAEERSLIFVSSLAPFPRLQQGTAYHQGRMPPQQLWSSPGLDVPGEEQDATDASGHHG